jgi:hypothetical protein
MGISECDVGITAFANDAAGIDAILRHRYTDFKVNEIGTDMQVAVYLGDTLPPQIKNAAVSFDNPEAVQALANRIQEVAGAENAETFTSYVKALLNRVRVTLRAWHLVADLCTRSMDHVSMQQEHKHCQSGSCLELPYCAFGIWWFGCAVRCLVDS